MKLNSRYLARHIIGFLALFVLLSGCHLFKQGRYKVVNGMKFHSFTLDNQLQVLAISDDRFVKSTAAMAVMSGSMQNPNDQLGLAHFLEHMLFLGTKDFPKVGDYEDYLNKNGGGHNAYTSIDHTNYFFDVDHKAFEGALHRFSRFFVSPTFDSEYVEREKNAVNSEHEKNLKDDYRREYRFQQVISDQNHPFAKFATGDKNTLAKASRDIVMDFYKKTYSSNLMRLVMMSNLSPDQLEKLAKSYFKDIPNRKLNKPEYSDTLFVQQGLPRFHQVKSIRDTEVLKMSFDIPDDLDYWKSKPVGILAHLIGDEGEGSILSYLKKKGWALGLSSSTWWRMFHVRITLTEEGVKHRDEIIEVVLSYIKMLKKEGLKKYLFEERKALAEVELQNIEPKSSMSRSSEFSASMLYYPVEEFLKQHYLYHEYKPEDYEKFVSYLNADNMQVTLFANDLKTDQREEFYGIEYQSGPFDEKVVQKWRDVGIYPELKYPEPNPYIPTDLELVDKANTYPPVEKNYKDKATIFYQVDTDLQIPKGSIGLALISDIVQGDPKTYLLAQLYAIAKKQELNEWGYPAIIAGLNYNVSHGHNTITLEVSGYTHHLSEFMQNIIIDKKHNRRIDQVEIDKDLFEKIKTKYKKNLLNKEFDSAYNSLFYELSQMFSTGAVHRKHYIDMVSKVTLKDINDFAKKYFSKVAVRSYSYGNIKPEAITDAIDVYFKEISDKTFSEKDVETFENKFVEMQNKHFVFSMNGKKQQQRQRQRVQV